jgi:hypothetical protein
MGTLRPICCQLPHCRPLGNDRVAECYSRCKALCGSSMRRHLRTALLICAALISVALFALAIGIFFWGVDLEHPESANVTGILLCFSPVLSLPAFMIVVVSKRWHRRVMWLMAGLSFAMTWFAILYRGFDGKFTMHEALSTLRVTVQPLVLMPLLLAVLVEFAYQLKQNGIPARD